jgi:hypothetical protein
MVEELLREFIAEPWVDQLDFSTAERVNATFVSQFFNEREGDMVWKIQSADGTPVYLYILLEFQSRVEPFMPLRGMVYEGLLYQELIARKRLSPSGKLPLVIVVILYNGEEPWGTPLELAELIERVDPSAEVYVPRLRCRLIDESRFRTEDLESRPSAIASLFRLERSLSWREVQNTVARLKGVLVEPEDRELQRVFAAWLTRLLRRRGISEEIPAMQDLEEVHDMLEQRIEEWDRRLKETAQQQGLQQGLQQGRREGGAELLLAQLEQRFGPLDEVSRMRVRSAEPDRLLEWGKRLFQAERLAEVFGDR